MAKRKRLLTEAAALKLWNGGRGQGDGATYQPWLTIHDVASRGLVSRIQGWRHQREHHLLSNGELSYFYQLEWSESVIDIREQFPLWPMDETRHIAATLGIKHPKPPFGKDFVTTMTSDFRITTADGRDVVRTVKKSGELRKRRTIEKLEVERYYWENQGIDWGIVIAEEIPKTFVRNIHWVHPHLRFDPSPSWSEPYELIVAHFTTLVRERDAPLVRLAKEVDTSYRLEKGSALALARHLIASRKWKINMELRINPSEPLHWLEGSQ